MNGKTPLVPDVGLLELVDCVLGGVDFGKNFRLAVLAFKRVVRFVPSTLQLYEGLGEVADFRWERTRHRLLLTRLSRLSVLKCTVHLMPFRAAAAIAGEQVGGSSGQTVEQRVVGRADGAAQVRLRGLGRAGLDRATGG